MNDEVVKKVMGEFWPHFEVMETQCAAILQFLKDKGIATDEQLAPYLEQAGNTSYVKWLTTRLRVEHIFSSTPEEPEKPAQMTPAEVTTEEASAPKEPEKPAELTKEESSSPETEEQGTEIAEVTAHEPDTEEDVSPSDEKNGQRTVEPQESPDAA